MIRRRTVIKAVREDQPARELLAQILANVKASWADCCRRSDWDSLDQVEFGRMLKYLENVSRNTRLFIPARDPDYGISERGGDAILGYLRNPGDQGAYFFFADVSGFTALLTFLTDRFGKEEAGDIMNLGILNRYCLNKMGLVLEHFKEEPGRGADRGVAALKVMLSIRAAMPLITREVRGELFLKLAGKPHQEEIKEFIKNLEVKSSGGLIFDRQAKSEFYGSRVRARITWGDTGKLVAQAEKLGGSDEKVHVGVKEVKGIGMDEHCYRRLDDLYAEGWLGLNPGDFAILESYGKFRKLVIRPSGMEKISGFIEDLCAGYEGRAKRSDTRGYAELGGQAERELLDEFGAGFLDIERYLGSRLLLLHIVQNLGSSGDKNILIDESCSAVRDSGVLFCNFELEDKGVLDSLVDEVHLIMSRYGIHYKYNIFTRGDFNLMGVLGTMFSERKGTDRYFVEILWNTWRDMKAAMEKTFGAAVKIRGGLSVGKALQGPAGDNIIHNEETIIGPDCNLAARLVNEALEIDSQGNFIYPSGSLFTIASQHRKVEHLIQPAQPVREASLKGFRKPVALYSLIERGEVETIVEFIARLRKVPLVTIEGVIVRDEESMRQDAFLAECMDVAGRTAAGLTERSQLVSFIAQSGVGKTRRIAELAHWALGKGWPVYFSECFSWYQGEGPGSSASDPDVIDQPESHSDEGAYPFYPFIRILKEQIFRINNVDPPELKRGKIAGVLSMLDPDNPGLAEQAPVLASFIGVEVPETGFSSALDAEARRNIFYERTGDIFAREVERQGGKGLVLLSIDDLQWSDRNSLHLLSFIMRRVGRGLVVCVNARKKHQLGILLDQDLPVDRHVFEPGLLQHGAIERLARLVLGVDIEDPEVGFPPELKAKLERELESNPFFVIEFCNKLLEQEIITVADGRCTRFDDETFRDVSIPNKIQGVIEDRIRRLPKTEHVAIQYSSVLGNILRYIIIRQFLPVVDHDRIFEGTDLAEIFSRLTGQEITRLENEKDPDWVYAFKRALIGEKLYQELVPSLRKRLHKEVARVFEKTELANRFEKVLLTALHYTNAEVPDKSSIFYLEAGKLAREVFDNERSLKLFDRIEKILKEHRIPDAGKRKTDMLENRGQVNLLLGRYDKALEDFQNLAAEASARADRELEARAHYLRGSTYFQRAGGSDLDRAIAQFAGAESKTADDRLLADILNDSARTYLEKGEREAALRLLDRAEEAFRRCAQTEPAVDDCIFEALLLRNRGSVFHRQGLFKKAIEIYNKALRLVDQEAENRFKKIRAMLYNSIGLSLMKAFKLEESLEYFSQALNLAHSIGDLKTELQVRINMGVVANDMGRNKEALQMLTEQLYMLEMLVGETRELAALEFNIGESHMFMENYAEAEPRYRRALDIGERVGYKEFVVATRYNLGEVLHTLKRPEEALEVLEPGYGMAVEGGWDLQRMDLANLLGEIHREAGRFSKAGEYHEQALDLGRKLEDEFGTSWALRNVALDTLEDPQATEEDLGACASLLEESLELARKAGQPENLMYSLRELIRYKLDRRNDPPGARPLYEELKKLADKVESKQFGSFCESVRDRLREPAE
ncbi:MAG TPA: tetratricopeptide repeat protein [archaeon]|nr:tetratricopeptide repeat protein [archaeon]